MTKFRVHIQDVYPDVAILMPLQSPFMGVSLSSRMFHEGRGDALFLWFAENSIHGLILIADLIERYDFVALEGMSMIAATERALMRGESCSHHITDIFRNVRPRPTILRWKDITLWDSYDIYRAQVYVEYERNPSFRAAVQQESHRFLRSTTRFRKMAADPSSLEVLSLYVLEELAVFPALYKEGWMTEIYPGSDLSILREIQAGKFPNLKWELPSRVHIRIGFRQSS
jgi:tRNA-dependent cyclodipeptide synthase